MLSIESNIKQVAGKIAKLESKIQEESKKKVRATLRRRIGRLQAELRFLVNEYAKVEGTNKDITAQPLAQKIAEEQALGKSRTVNYGDDFATTFDSPTYKAALVNGGNNYAMRVRDSSIHPDATYEDYRNSFMSTLTDKVFAIQDEGTGAYRYYTIDPGSPLLDEVLDGVKIFCSSYTDSAGMGRDDGDPLQDIGINEGRRKFARDKNKGFTEFTLKEDAIRAIRDRGRDVTEIVTNTQHGEYEDAYSIAKNIDTPAMKKVTERAAEAMENADITPEAKAVANTNKAINDISIKERTKKDSVEYIIQTLVDEKQFTSDEVIHAIKREVIIWSREEEGPIRESVEQAIQQAIKDIKGA